MIRAVRETADFPAAHTRIRMVANTHTILAHSIVIALVGTNTLSRIKSLEAKVAKASSIHTNTMIVTVTRATKVAAVVTRKIREAHAFPSLRVAKSFA